MKLGHIDIIKSGGAMVKLVLAELSRVVLTRQKKQVRQTG